jgi:hypothetical protein
MTQEEMANDMVDQIIRDAEAAPLYRPQLQRLAALLAMLVQDVYGGRDAEASRL